MVQGKIHTRMYIAVDFISAALAWAFFFVYRKISELGTYYEAIDLAIRDIRLLQGLIFIPLGWILLYAVFGYYRKTFSKNVFSDFTKTFICTICGVAVLFFLVILDDVIPDYRLYYNYLFVLFVVHFGFTSLGRILHTRWTSKAIRTGKIAFNTLLVGDGFCAQNIYAEFRSRFFLEGYNILGYVRTGKDLSIAGLECLGMVNDLKKIVETSSIEDIIIALDDEDAEMMSDILSNLVSYKFSIRVSPNLEIFLHQRSTFSLHTPLLLLSADPLPDWQNSLKRILDVVFSILLGILLLPLILFVILRLLRDSGGTVFYAQQRIGIYERPFTMYKFRSMYKDAEAPDFPKLSSEDDQRVTSFGRIMRKYRIDELPQLWNVLKGDMSLVGPRPERRYYIDRITQITPQYKLLLRVRPGLTSWGEIKYGYASSVSQMIERMKFDLQYLNNLSLSNDLKILCYTIITVLRGEGK